MKEKERVRERECELEGIRDDEGKRDGEQELRAWRGDISINLTKQDPLPRCSLWDYRIQGQ